MTHGSEDILFKYHESFACLEGLSVDGSMHTHSPGICSCLARYAADCCTDALWNTLHYSVRYKRPII